MHKPIKIDIAAASKTDPSALVSLNRVVQAMHGRDWVYPEIAVALNSSNFNEGRHAFFKRLDYSA